MLLILTYLFSTLSLQCAFAKGKAAKTKQKKSGKIAFSTKPISPNVQKLPPYYIGHDVVELYLKLDTFKKQCCKDHSLNAICKDYKEGECGPYDEIVLKPVRVDVKPNTPLMGNLKGSDYLAFAVNDPQITYSTHDKEFTVNVPLINNGNVMSVRLGSTHDTSSYEASNMFGATTTVESYSTDVYKTVINNFKEFPITFNRICDGFNCGKEYSLAIKIKASPDEVEKIKKQTWILLIGKLDKPFSSDHIARPMIEREPTFDHPYEFSSMSKYIYINLVTALAYNPLTGEVYTRINKNAGLSDYNTLIIRNDIWKDFQALAEVGITVDTQDLVINKYPRPDDNAHHYISDISWKLTGTLKLIDAKNGTLIRGVYFDNAELNYNKSEITVDGITFRLAIAPYEELVISGEDLLKAGILKEPTSTFKSNTDNNNTSPYYFMPSTPNNYSQQPTIPTDQSKSIKEQNQTTLPSTPNNSVTDM